ncbi:MAG: hypothetical protein H7831_15055 [Magnetococcus sp. WYHC-3]
MALDLFLFVADQYVILYPRIQRVFGQGVRFLQQEGEAERMGRYLDDHDFVGDNPDHRLLVVVDMAEEHIQIETMPELNLVNRTELIRRRSERLFRNSRFRHSRLLGKSRDDTHRGLREVLHTAITAPQSLEPWLKVFQERRLPLEGIWSLPLLSQQFLTQVSSGRETALLIMISSAGLRQVYFQEGHFKISRLTPLRFRTPLEILGHIVLEIGKTRGYLNSLRLHSWSDPLEVHLLCHGALLAEARSMAKAIEDFTLHPVDALDLGVRLKLKYQGEELKLGGRRDDLDLLYCQMLTRRRTLQHYATPAELRIHRTNRLKRSVYAASMILPLLGVGAGGWMLSQGEISLEALPPLLHQQGIHTLERNRERERIPPTEIPYGDLLTGVETAAALEKLTTTPWALMVLLSEVLEQHPRLKLEHFEWVAVPGPHWPVKAPPLEAVNEAETLRVEQPAAEGAPEAAPVAGLYQLALLSGQVTPFDGQYRLALGRVQSFMEDLRKRPEVFQVVAEKLPLDIDPQSGLDETIRTGETGRSAVQTAPFRLKIILEPLR